ncbi:MAG: hypothetical protein RIR00_1309 [Pseudomonadota bacterium]|jgi:hypothetical protein
MRIDFSELALHSDHKLEQSRSTTLADSDRFARLLQQHTATPTPTPMSPVAAEASLKNLSHAHWQANLAGQDDGNTRQKLDALFRELLSALQRSLTRQAHGCADTCSLGDKISGLLQRQTDSGNDSHLAILQDSRQEWENTEVTARGHVHTADGKDLVFNLELTMTRMSRSEDLAAGISGADLRDPLVINFNGPARLLAGQSMSFDLDGNGQLENIPLLAAGHAFLAFDRNGDNRISNGGELFGTRSGNGFADLAAWDSDHNGWIDSGDRDFSRLALWFPDPHGGRLQSLGEAGVGAISVAAIASPFQLQEQGRLRGEVSQTGLWLAENGEAHSVQQVDLASSR